MRDWRTIEAQPQEFPIHATSWDTIVAHITINGGPEATHAFGIRECRTFPDARALADFVWRSRIVGTFELGVPIYEPCPLLLGWKGDLKQ